MIDRYSRKELRALWSDSRRYDVWLEVELAACTAMEREGTVPAGTAARVRDKAAGKLNPARILEIEERTRHDVIAFRKHVEERARVDVAGGRRRRDPGRARSAAGGAQEARRGASPHGHDRPLARHPRRAGHARDRVR